MSYLADYLEYSTDNEAPEMFHVWAGYATLSSAIGRRVWLTRGESVVYPNIYVLLNGAAGCGKSTAIYKARRIMSELGINISNSVETPEGMLEFIAGNAKAEIPVPSPCMKLMSWPDGVIRETHQMTIVANEFIDFISKNQEGWTSMLNNIYDEDMYNYRTKNKGENVLTGPYIVLLGAIPTEISKKLQREEIISTGFARRTFMQYGERQFHRPHADPTFSPEQKAARDRCVERLKGLQKLSGPMIRTEAAGKWWKNWYDNHSLTLMKRATPATQGWLSSKPDQVVKLAILNSLSNRDDLTIIPEDFELGLAYITEMERSFHMVFGGVGRNELAGVSMKVLEYLTALNEPVTFKALAMKFFASFTAGKGISELTECLTHLVNTEQLESKSMVVTAANGQTLGTDTVYATPAGMKAFAERNVKSSARPLTATLPSSPVGSAPVVGPSTVPPSSLGFAVRTDQVAVLPESGIEGD